MARIKDNYDTHTKDDLLTEAHLRKLDVNTGTNKADIIAALELSDEATAAKPKAPASTSPDPIPSTPKIESQEEAAQKANDPSPAERAKTVVSTQSPDEGLKAANSRVAELEAQLAKEREKNPVILPVSGREVRPFMASPKRHDLHTFTKGRWRDRESGEVFLLRIDPQADFGRTHQFANEEHYRELTPEAAALTMEKE